MKNLIYITLILLSVSVGYSIQSSNTTKLEKSGRYRVIKVNGKIFFIKTGNNMKIGDYFVEGTPLKFSTLKDRAAVISKEKGRFVLQPNIKGKPKVLPATSNIATRGPVSYLNNWLDVKNYFSDHCLFLGEAKLKMGKEAFPLDEKHFFYVKYHYNDEVIAKKIPQEDNSIVFSENELFKIDGKKVPTAELEMVLYYRSGDVSNKVNTFTPVFPQKDILKSEVALLLEELGDVSVAKKEQEIIAFLNEFYGKPQTDNLNKWLEDEFEIRIEKEINFK